MLTDFNYAELKESAGKHYVYFRAFNPAKKKKDTCRIYIKKYDDPKMIIKHGKRLVVEVNKKLDNGWNPFLEKDSGKLYTSVIDALDSCFQLMSKGKSSRTVETYRYTFKKLTTWLQKRKSTKIFICEFSSVMAQDFMDSQLLQGIGGKTHNNLLIQCRTIFNNLIKRGYAKENPFHKVDELPEEETTKRAFSPEERKVYVDYLLEKAPEMYIPSALIFYLALRPIEIRRIQCFMFDLKNGIATIPASVSKNNKTRHLTIPQQFIKDLKKHMEYSRPSDFLVSKTFHPGPKQLSRNTLSYNYMKIRKKLELPEELKLYSLKDTAADQLVLEGFNVKDIRDHYRHHSVNMTDKYLKTKSKNYSYNLKVANEYPRF